MSFRTLWRSRLVRAALTALAPSLLIVVPLLAPAVAAQTAAPEVLVWWQGTDAPEASHWTTLHRLTGSLIGFAPAGDAVLSDARAQSLGAFDEPASYLLVNHPDLRALASGKLPPAWSVALDEAGAAHPSPDVLRGMRALAADDAQALIRLPEALHPVAEAPGGRCQKLARQPLATLRSAFASDAVPGGSDAGFAPPVPSRAPLAAPAGEDRAELWSAFNQALSDARMFADLDYLSTGLATRHSYTDQMNLACDYVLAEFQALGLTAYFDEFTLSGHPLKNVVAVKEGALDPSVVYVIGGHLDSTSNDPYDLAPGAEDNGSGAAAVVETARLLAPLTCDYTIYFVCFSAEEQGLVGSEHFAAWADAQDLNIQGVLIHDMIGYYDPDNEDLWLEGFRDAPSSSWLMDMVQGNAVRYGGLSVFRYPGDGWGSDHVPFHDHGFPAMLSIENEWDEYPCYHRTCDEVQWLDGSLWANIAGANAITLAQIAGVRDSVAVVTGRVSGETGGPLSGVTLTLVGTRYPMQISGLGGQFTWPAVLPGEYTLLAQSNGYEPGTVPFTVTSGATLELAVTLAVETSSAVGAERALPGTPRLRVVPSVVSGRTVIALALPSGERGSLSIHSLDGRLQRRLAPAAQLGAGEHAFPWDGRDRDGRRLPAGIYSVRWEGERGRAQTALLVVG